MNPILPSPIATGAGQPGGPLPSAVPHQPRPAAPCATARPVRPPAEPQSVGPLDEQLALAAGALFRDRQVAVETLHDEASGRLVVRVEDRLSGEVVAQMPPEDLLRFWAAVREGLRLVDTLT
ncbi:MAG: flagellar protein FlaG [Geminicoccaceae bacterium]|nr:flagellar protein FlaG [Geminicoccaceae bacterium]